MNVCGAANTIIPIQLSVYKFRQCGILEEKTQEETLMNVNDPRWASIDAFVEGNRDNILRDITRLVAVPSVEGTPEPGAPFGPGPKAALAPTPSACGMAGCWAAAWPTIKAPASCACMR